jgi:hypothetical protein
LNFVDTARDLIALLTFWLAVFALVILIVLYPYTWLIATFISIVVIIIVIGAWYPTDFQEISDITGKEVIIQDGKIFVKS